MLLLSALARLYESGGADLTPDVQLARQFHYLARSAMRRERASREAEEDLGGEGSSRSSEDDGTLV